MEALDFSIVQQLTEALRKAWDKKLIFFMDSEKDLDSEDAPAKEPLSLKKGVYSILLHLHLQLGLGETEGFEGKETEFSPDEVLEILEEAEAFVELTRR